MQNARNIGITGAVTGTATAFNGTSNINIPATAINPDYLSKVVPISKGGTGNTTGHAQTASKLVNARNIALSGAISGNANFDGSANVNISTICPTSKIIKNLSNNGILINLIIKKQLNLVYVNLTVIIPKNTTTVFTINSAIPTGYIPNENVGVHVHENNTEGQFVKLFLRNNGRINGVAHNADTLNSVTIVSQVVYIIG